MLLVDIIATGLQIEFFISLLVIVYALLVPSKTSGQPLESQATAHTSICRAAVALVPVVTFPLMMMSSKPSVALSITADSRPASRLVSLARLASEAVITVVAPYFCKTSFAFICHPSAFGR